MKNNYQSIPTVYKNIQFRSRLEATWACFFDLVGWRWEYEPVDFAGWIPDFALYGKDIIYVEVKPVITFPQNIADEIDKSGCDKEALILGQTPTLPYQFGGDLTLGWLREGDYDEDKTTWWWDRAVMGRWAAVQTIGFCHACGWFADRISGEYDGGCYGSGQVDQTHIQGIWAQAKNTTQWMK